MKKLLTVIELLLVLIVLACAGFLGFYFYQGHEAKTGFNEIKEQIPEEVD